MIVCSERNLTYPLDTTQLYWLTLTGRGGLGQNFFFASPDGTRLVSALDDADRFTAVLAAEIPLAAGFPCVKVLQTLLQALTPVPPTLPRYPQIGQTGVKGVALWASELTTYFQQGADGPKPPTPIWIGVILADIADNRYDTPPAYESEIQFQFQFRSDYGPPIESGQAVVFDIMQGNFYPCATNVRPA